MGPSKASGLLPTYASVGSWPHHIVNPPRAQGTGPRCEYAAPRRTCSLHVPTTAAVYTSFIQTTATLGFFVSLGVIGTCRVYLGAAEFRSWGWRVPFLASFVLLGVSLYIRLKMQESPLFTRLKADGQLSRNPLKESFGNPRNRRYVLLALFGATAGQGVVWYTGQFYALTFLQKPLNLDWRVAYILVSIALALGTPFFIVFGRLVDRVGRKRIMLAGCLLAALTYVPPLALKAVINPGMAARGDHSLVGAGAPPRSSLRADAVRDHGYGPIAATSSSFSRPRSVTRRCRCRTTWARLVRRIPAPHSHRVTTSAWSRETFARAPSTRDDRTRSRYA